MEAPPGNFVTGLVPGMARPPTSLSEPYTLPPAVEGPSIRDAPPDGRNSSTVLVTTTTPIRLAPFRPWRQGCMLYNEDSTNGIRYGESAAGVLQTQTIQGALLPAAGAVILRGSPEIWAIALNSSVRMTVVDEWFSAPPQRQPMGI